MSASLSAPRGSLLATRGGRVLGAGLEPACSCPKRDVLPLDDPGLLQYGVRCSAVVETRQIGVERPETTRAQCNPSQTAADIPFPTTASSQRRSFSCAAARIFMRHHHMLASPIGTVAGLSGVFGCVGRQICRISNADFGEYPFHAFR
jgi:hypothetical protein